MKSDEYSIDRESALIDEFKPKTISGDGYDLLNISLIRSLIDWKGFPYVFQFLMLLVFASFIFIGWQVYTPENINDKLFAKANIVTLIIWGIWWPLMVWLAVSMGRVWCMICPLELVSNITERVSRKLGMTQKALSRWMRGGAIIVFLYALIQLLVAGIHLHRIPAFTSFFLIGLLALSAFVGFFLKDRAFCRGFCPIGMLLNAYGRGGMIAVRPGSGDTCKSCTGKDCIMACNRNKLDRRSCPSLLNPPKLNSNKDCLVCGQCIKSCQPDNMQLLLRKPFHKADAREEKAGWALTIFIMLVSGFVTSELTTEWKAANHIFLIIPEYLTNLFNLHSFAGFIEGIWTIAIFPLLLWTIFGAITVAAKGAESIRDAWRKLALPLVIIVAAGHLTKAVAKLNTWLGFFPGSMKDPSGVATAKSITAGISVPAALISNQMVSVIGMVLLTIAFIYSMREEKIITNNLLPGLIPKLLLFAVYAIIVIGIGF